MIPERYSLAWRDGWLCVRYDTTEVSEPIIVSLYWPIGPMSMLELFQWKHPIGDQLSTAGSYTFEHYKRTGQNRVYRLQDAGATRPIARELSKAKRPKRVRNVAWYFGRWRVTTKTRVYDLPVEFPLLSKLI